VVDTYIGVCSLARLPIAMGSNCTVIPSLLARDF
jgi:hypothetical protein